MVDVLILVRLPLPPRPCEVHFLVAQAFLLIHPNAITNLNNSYIHISIYV